MKNDKDQTECIKEVSDALIVVLNINTAMILTHFVFLPDIVLLEIFSYLSCEDILYAFGSLQEVDPLHLLTECGAFHQIRLSSQLSRHQYKVLSENIWRYDLVRSFVCKEMFSDFMVYLTPCQVFPSLTQLRVCCLRCVADGITDFVIAHSSTLTHLTMERSDQSFIPEDYQTFVHTVVPHLKRLKLLDTDWRSYVSV